MGEPDVRINGIAIYHYREDEVSSGIEVWNDGNRDAFSVSVCAKIDFFKPPPIPSKCEPFEPQRINQLPFTRKGQKPEVGAINTAKITNSSNQRNGK